MKVIVMANPKANLVGGNKREKIKTCSYSETENRRK